jgi:SAM-dependent methyltransferase
VASADDRPSVPVTAGRRLRWVVLALVPSSLMLGVTNYLSTDLAAIPLMWVVPLALYLLTFILVFASRPLLPHSLMARILPIGVLALTLVVTIGATEPLVLLIGLHLATFFVAAMVCHGELARDRPDTGHLTDFYLCMSVGGVLGGAFNALAAPLIFSHAGLVEYPLMLVVACLLRPATFPQANTPQARRRDVLFPVILGVVTAAIVLAVQWRAGNLDQFARSIGIPEHVVRSAVAFGIPAIVAFTFVDRPRRFALGVAALMLAGALDPGPTGRAVLTDRNFFGVVRVTHDPEGRFTRMVHGNTIHGQQSDTVRDPDGRHEPLTYYHKTGPTGHLFNKLYNPGPMKRSVAVIGLGTGTLAYYAQPGQDWTYYEIDPAVARIASSQEHYFDFFRECRAGEPKVVLGDARLRLAEAPDGAFGLIVLDAFSSDAIPIHLLTIEAMRLYLQKLAPGGVLLFHVSNRYLDLHPILARLASEAGPLTAYKWDDLFVSEAHETQGKQASQWVAMSRDKATLVPLHKPIAIWDSLPDAPDAPLWRDDFSNLLSAWKRLKN